MLCQLNGVREWKTKAVDVRFTDLKTAALNCVWHTWILVLKQCVECSQILWYSVTFSCNFCVGLFKSRDEMIFLFKVELNLKV